MDRQNIAPIAWILALAVTLAACVTLEGLAYAKPAQTPETDEVRLGRALGTTAPPTLAGESPCSSPGLYSETSKSECILLDYGPIRALLFYPGLRGENPKPAKAYRQDASGLWYAIALPPRISHGS